MKKQIVEIHTEYQSSDMQSSFSKRNLSCSQTEAPNSRQQPQAALHFLPFPYSHKLFATLPLGMQQPWQSAGVQV